jgi:hypothetical protein
MQAESQIAGGIERNDVISHMLRKQRGRDLTEVKARHQHVGKTYLAKIDRHIELRKGLERRLAAVRVIFKHTMKDFLSRI